MYGPRRTRVVLGRVNRVLVPGASAPAGINTIKSLKMADFGGKILATDSDPLSAGFYMAHDSCVMPLVKDEDEFVDRLFQNVREYGVDLLMPSSGYDIYLYSKYRSELKDMGAVAVVSDPVNLETCTDKLKTYDFLKADFQLPFTTTDPKETGRFPVIAKPRFGKGSRNVIKIENEAELRHVASQFKDMIFQEFLPGTEYTIDVLSDLEANALFAVPRIRLQTKEGISTKGKVVRHPSLERECMKMAKAVGIRGPCCIQMKESAEGKLKLVEINPRMGGGTIFSALAGANIPAMIVAMVEGKKVTPPKISEITVLRYFEEIVA
jgi:carbamoyl-phosphate synthase large subunit